MLGCWKADPKERLTFDKIHKHLHDYHSRLVKMAAASQPTTPVTTDDGEAEVEDGLHGKSAAAAPTSDLLSKEQMLSTSSSPQLSSPGSKAPLKGTPSDPDPASFNGKTATGPGSPAPPAVSRTASSSASSSPLNEPKAPREFRDLPEAIVKIPPSKLDDHPAAAVTDPSAITELEPDADAGFVESGSAVPTLPLAKAGSERSSSLVKLHGMDSGFSSGEQHWTVPEVEPPTTLPTPPHRDIVVEPLTSIVCTQPAEIV